jgi:hypothetical protein
MQAADIPREGKSFQAVMGRGQSADLCPKFGNEKEVEKRRPFIMLGWTFGISV